MGEKKERNGQMCWRGVQQSSKRGHTCNVVMIVLVGFFPYSREYVCVCLLAQF